MSRPLLAEPLNDASLAASPVSACQHGAKTAPEAAFQAVAFTGTGAPAALAAIWLSIAWNCWYIAELTRAA